MNLLGARRPRLSRTVLLCAGAASAVVGLCLVGLVVGDYPVPVRSAIATALWDRGGEFDFVINSLRLPRLTVAVLAGMCLAASGALFQALIDNPLVSPDIIGIDTGAAAAAVTILAVGFDSQLLPFAAFGGAFATAAMIFVLAWRRGASGGRIVLVGIGINALLSALITYMLVRFRSSESALPRVGRRERCQPRHGTTRARWPSALRCWCRSRMHWSAACE